MTEKAATLEISELMQFLRQELDDLPDERKPGNNRKYEVEDAVMAAFSVFFTQSPSFLDHQRWLFGLCYAMDRGYKRWNPYRERHLAIFVNCFLSRAN
jgi:hypothetical protein